MQALAQIAVPVVHPVPNSVEIPKPGSCFLRKPSKFHHFGLFGETQIRIGRLPASPLHSGRTHFAPMAASSASVGSADYVEEPATKVKFLKSLNAPGCSSTPLSLLGTGYREKVFAIIGVKVYAAGLYANPSIFKELSSWKGKSSAEAQEDLSLFTSMYQSPSEKSLQIVLARDIDGKTFWNALNEALSSTLKTPTPDDESTLSTFKGIFEGRSLKKGTLIYLTWLKPSKMLVSVSSDGTPAGLDGQVTSLNVSKALFDVFFDMARIAPVYTTKRARRERLIERARNRKSSISMVLEFVVNSSVLPSPIR